MKRYAWTAVGLGVLAALFWAWFVTTFEQVEVREPSEASAAARANPYLAAMRFAERLGWKTALEDRPVFMPEMPSDATIVLPRGRVWLARSRAQALLGVAASGAHLIVEAEAPGNRDVMLEAVGFGTRRAQQGTDFEARVPGADAPLHLAPVFREPVIDAGEARPDLVVGDAQGVRFASLRTGHGRITVFASLDRFRNPRIGNFDHAELLRRTLALNPGDRLVLIRATDAPPLWSWLMEHASGLIAAAAIVGAAALWRALPRFGPIVPAPQPPRRQLVEHLRAAGRFRWSQGARAELLVAAREQLLHHVAAAAPRLAYLPPAQRHAELAAQLGADAATIERAFAAVPHNTRELVQITRTLATIHAQLRGAPPRRPRRRKHI